MTRIGLALIAAPGFVSCGQPAPPKDAATNDAAVPIANNPAPEGNVAAPTTPPFAEMPGAHPTAPEPAPIPAKFRGNWAESKAACADLKHHSRLGISGRTVRYPTHVLFGDSFSFPAANQFAVKGKVEGTSRPAEAHYSINAGGDVLTDEAGGGAVRVPCR